MNHPIDLLLVLFSLLSTAVPVWVALHFYELSPLALVLIGMVLLLVQFETFNGNHYNAHIPFFRGKILARLYDMVLSCAYGCPTVYYVGHVVCHHKQSFAYTNYRLGEFIGLDLASLRGLWRTIFGFFTYRFNTPVRALILAIYSYRHRHETIIAPALRDFDSVNSKSYAEAEAHVIPSMIAWASKGGNQRRMRVVVEALVAIAFQVTLIVLSWKAYLVFYLPFIFVINIVLGMWEFASHNGIVSEELGRDSVSCYGPIYNFLFFNSALHQEHHLRPKAHWSTLNVVRALAPPESERMVEPSMFLINALRRHPRFTGSVPAPSQQPPATSDPG